MTYGIWQTNNGTKYICHIYHTVDDIEENNYILKNVISRHGTSILPLRQNEQGGWCSLNDSSDTFLGEYQDKPLLTLNDIWVKNSPSFDLGWISPNGDTYSCGEYDHIRCAMDIASTFYFNYNNFISPDNYLISHGWVKVYKAYTKSMWLKSFNGSIHTITKKQWAVIDKFQIAPDWHMSKEMREY